MHLPRLNGVFKFVSDFVFVVLSSAFAFALGVLRSLFFPQASLAFYALNPRMLNDHVDLFPSLASTRAQAFTRTFLATLRPYAAAPRRSGRAELFKVRNRLALVFMLLYLSPLSYHHCAAGCRISGYLFLNFPSPLHALRSRSRPNVGPTITPIRKVTAELPRVLLESSPTSTRAALSPYSPRRVCSHTRAGCNAHRFHSPPSPAPNTRPLFDDLARTVALSAYFSFNTPVVTMLCVSCTRRASYLRLDNRRVVIPPPPPQITPTNSKRRDTPIPRARATSTTSTISLLRYPYFSDSPYATSRAPRTTHARPTYRAPAPTERPAPPPRAICSSSADRACRSSHAPRPPSPPIPYATHPHPQRLAPRPFWHARAGGRVGARCWTAPRSYYSSPHREARPLFGRLDAQRSPSSPPTSIRHFASLRSTKSSSRAFCACSCRPYWRLEYCVRARKLGDLPTWQGLPGGFVSGVGGEEGILLVGRGHYSRGRAPRLWTGASSVAGWARDAATRRGCYVVHTPTPMTNLIVAVSSSCCARAVVTAFLVLGAARRRLGSLSGPQEIWAPRLVRAGCARG
ncbi:hypothetical protein C8J57DRAFT_1549593 [Mycena rebaudengoi]|nr:hypothetical protein C8J57DRAFT_1549593 [Mycena rebaudengoi]